MMVNVSIAQEDGKKEQAIIKIVGKCSIELKQSYILELII